LQGLGIENVVICYDHLEYFTAIWYNLWPFVYFVVIWYIFMLWYVWTKKNLATLRANAKTKTKRIGERNSRTEEKQTKKTSKKL
jgi:phosphotransferase system  glucose/maltose/N-acetylglucosamine-specific IIC component